MLLRILVLWASTGFIAVNVLPTSAEDKGGDKTQQQLTLEESKTVRDLATGENGILTSGLVDKREGIPTVLVPESLAKLFKTKPTTVLQLLRKIADGAAPDHSVVAVTYIVALAGDPSVASVCTSLHKAETYDVLDKNWKCSPREHWLSIADKKVLEFAKKTKK